MKETTPRNATTEMTIIRTDKIAFDERQPVALHLTQTFLVLVEPYHSSLIIPSSLTHTLPLIAASQSLSARNRSDRKRSRTGNSTRLIRDGRKNEQAEPAELARAAGRLGVVATVDRAGHVSGVCSVERQQIDDSTCASTANVSVALSEH